MGNPAIFPLIYGCESKDIVIVPINLLEREDPPRTAADPRPSQRDQFQLVADARNARDQLRHTTY